MRKRSPIREMRERGIKNARAARPGLLTILNADSECGAELFARLDDVNSLSAVTQ